jgi:hypothetical protein
LKPQSPLFGKDIVIHDSSSQNQRQVAVCSVFNGWLYCVYSYIDPYGTASVTILRSEDTGLTWKIFMEDVLFLPYSHCSSLDIAVIGDSVSNLKVFLAFVLLSNSNNTEAGDGEIWQFNGETGIFENGLFSGGACYIALATDQMYTPNNSSQSILGILYSTISVYGNHPDSIIFCSSSNGGNSIDNRQGIAIAGTNHHFHKVTLAYGKSPSSDNGIFFAAWEEGNNYFRSRGHIILHIQARIITALLPFP